MGIDDSIESSLNYHRYPLSGKLSIAPIKPLVSQKDLALAYSPGVAHACHAIVKDPNEALFLTSRSHLVAVVTNGTAVLGLGKIGPLAAKPVMEGKAVLFKKFSGLDAFDIEIQETDPEKLVEIIASLEPTFGGINLEDIKAPDCFYVEKKLKERLKIPVLHDDQHGTAIIVSAAVLNGLRLTGKAIQDVVCVTSGAGAAALACLDMLVSLGLSKKNIYVADMAGIIYEGRTENMDPYKALYANQTNFRSLKEAIVGADIFLGLSVANILEPEMVINMAPNPLILALANPEPEIFPELVFQVRSDAIVATGRSDYPNQVNNVLCFPYIFRGALDVGASVINDAMKKACVQALADLALTEPPEAVHSAYGVKKYSFGPEYLIPKPFDPRLLIELPCAVAAAAMDTNVALRPIKDLAAYRQQLYGLLFPQSVVTRPLVKRSQSLSQQRILFSEGENARVLQALPALIDSRIGQLVLVGRRSVIGQEIENQSLRLRINEDFEVIDPQEPGFLESYGDLYQKISGHDTLTPELIHYHLKNPTILGALLILNGCGDVLLCGPGKDDYPQTMSQLLQVLGTEESVLCPATLKALVIKDKVYFFADGYLNSQPEAFHIAAISRMAAEQVKRLGIEPRVALLGHSRFSSALTADSQKMRAALAILRKDMPELAVEIEVNVDMIFNDQVQGSEFAEGDQRANIFIMPDLNNSHLAFSLLKSLAGGGMVGPLLLGLSRSAHILEPGVTDRGIFDMAVLAVSDMQARCDNGLGQKLSIFGEFD